MTSESPRAASVRPAVPVVIALGLMVLSLPAFMFREQLYTAVTAAAGSSPALTLLAVFFADAASSTLKLLLTESRPCQSIHVAIAESCPPPGDWSWPSNHSVLAAAFATACALAVVRLRWYLAATALLIAAARVGVGAHYPHDVLFGLGLGMLVVLAVVHLLPRLLRLLPGTGRIAQLTGGL